MKDELKKIEVHDLWLVSSFFYPLLRDMALWADPLEREVFKLRAETLIFKLFGEVEVASTDDESY